MLQRKSCAAFAIRSDSEIAVNRVFGSSRNPYQVSPIARRRQLVTARFRTAPYNSLVMNRFASAALGVAALGSVLAAQSAPPKTVRTPSAKTTPKLAVAHAPPTAELHSEIVTQYCVGCHSEKGKAGGLSLVTFDAAHAEQNAEVAERMIRKLRAGMMPPPGARRPAADELSAFLTALENKIDAAAARHPNPGHRVFQRLSRAEYARSVRELVDVDVDVTAFLPADTISAGFDNIADAQAMSPTLMEGYLRAASKISAVAIGD